jgi:hypothetical protein
VRAGRVRAGPRPSRAAPIPGRAHPGPRPSRAAPIPGRAHRGPRPPRAAHGSGAGPQLRRSWTKCQPERANRGQRSKIDAAEGDRRRLWNADPAGGGPPRPEPGARGSMRRLRSTDVRI